MKPSLSTKFPPLTGAVISTCTLSQGSPSPYPRKLTTIGFVAVLKLTRVSRTLNSLQVHYRYIKNTYIYIYIYMYIFCIYVCMSEFPVPSSQLQEHVILCVRLLRSMTQSNLTKLTSQRAIAHSGVGTLKLFSPTFINSNWNLTDSLYLFLHWTWCYEPWKKREAGSCEKYIKFW